MDESCEKPLHPQTMTYLIWTSCPLLDDNYYVLYVLVSLLSATFALLFLPSHQAALSK